VNPLAKNVYSLVLLDDVVDAVDKLAYERSTSRSSLINQILAEYLSCPTPENRIHNIFDCMEKMFSGLDNFQFHDQPSESMVSIRSALHYRYRPTVRYALELYREPGPYLGELRISFRTQNSELLELSEEFFRFWESLESRCIASLFQEGQIPCSAEPGRYSRRLRCPPSEEDRTCEKIAQAILSYIRAFDAAMKEYFAGTDNAADTGRNIETKYLEWLKNALIL
jgi:predicted transcriptional regulator